MIVHKFFERVFNMELLREPTKGKFLEIKHFPTSYQTLIFRLWEMVSAKKIAKVINTSEENVRKAALDMGLKEQKDLEHWMTRGYISIIRAVWNLLPYEQIYTLMDWDAERLSFCLREDDFLGLKLGEKCECPEVLYRELTENEKEQTKKIKETVENFIRPLDKFDIAKPFDFFESKYGSLVSVKNREVLVDSSWALEYTDAKLSDFVEDFKNFALKYGVEFSESGDKKIVLEMNIRSDDEEYHEIHINDDLIKIIAPSPVGILRGLYDLEDLVESAGTFSFDKKVYKKKTKVKTRFIYSFCGLYADVLDKYNKISLPDELLEGYARRGINGVWIQGVLYKIAPYPFNEKESEGWETRLENLKALTERAARYGIKVYMYINEPRCMPEAFFKNRPDMKGISWRDDGAYTLCSSHPETHKYLKDALQTICKKVPLIGGFFNITQSENNVLCTSRGNRWDEKHTCPVCTPKGAYKVTAEILSTMANAVYEIDKNIKFFAYAWTWTHDYGDDTEKLIASLPKNVIVLQVSESKMKFVRCGIEGEVRDYSLSIVGPGEPAKQMWGQAKKYNLETAAKIQINNSWECSTSQFLPVYDNVIEHMKNLTEFGVDHMMLSWTLGGYFSDSLKIASSYFFEDNETKTDVYEEVLKNTYGDYAKIVKESVHHFCKGFAEYPFNIYHLYRGPSNAGVANLLYTEPSNMRSTTTCFAYDDIKGWCARHKGDDTDGWTELYTGEVLKTQYDLLCREWEKGLDIIKDMPTSEFKDMAIYGYTLFKASYNQTAYYLERDGKRDKKLMRELVENEKELALKAYEIMLRNSAVGYEAANHYYVTKSQLMEKIVQCDYILSEE